MIDKNMSNKIDSYLIKDLVTNCGFIWFVQQEQELHNIKRKKGRKYVLSINKKGN